MEDQKLSPQQLRRVKFLNRVFSLIIFITERLGKKLEGPSTDTLGYPRFVYELSIGSFRFKTETNRGVLPGADKIQVKYHFPEGYTHCVLEAEFHRGDDMGIVCLIGKDELVINQFTLCKRWQTELLRTISWRRMPKERLLFWLAKNKI